MCITSWNFKNIFLYEYDQSDQIFSTLNFYDFEGSLFLIENFILNVSTLHVKIDG